jgi:hypothetical protein
MKKKGLKKIRVKKLTLSNLERFETYMIKGGATGFPCATKFCSKPPLCYSWNTEQC